MTERERAGDEVREGIRSGILASLRHDVELRGGRTARLLAASGVVGALGAIGATLLIARHPFGHHSPWHMLVFSTVWAGLLVASSAIALLRVRTPTLPLSESACVAILGLGLAGICGALCPDQHFLHWWTATAIGDPLLRAGGLALAAACFGLVTTLAIGAVATLLVLRDAGRRVPLLLPAALLVALLAPGVALQSVGTSAGTFAAWLAGTAAGAYGGVAGGVWLGARARPARPG